MAIQDLLIGLGDVPSAAIIFFFVLGAVLIAELWYLRPKRKLPPIPPPAEPLVSPSPGGLATSPVSPTSPPPQQAGFKPLSSKQIYLAGFLIFLLLILPLAVFLYKRTQETQKAVTWLPSPTAVVGESAPPTRTPRVLPIPTLTPFPKEASPSATPRELAGRGLATPTPTSTSTLIPKPTTTPMATPKWESKGGLVSPSPSGTPLPKTQKPGELPDASFSDQALFLILAGLPALLIGANKIKRKLG